MIPLRSQYVSAGSFLSDDLQYYPLNFILMFLSIFRPFSHFLCSCLQGEVKFVARTWFIHIKNFDLQFTVWCMHLFITGVWNNLWLQMHVVCNGQCNHFKGWVSVTVTELMQRYRAVLHFHPLLGINYIVNSFKGADQNNVNTCLFNFIAASGRLSQFN